MAIEDLGDHLVLKPVPEDPIAAARGALQGRIGSTAKLREAARRDELEAERRRR